ncbi:MAG: 50S ribosomal protein L10 [Tissierellia bacterium]|nr:50S ribosomal protein L10 [Tissierellia bacterium]
MREAKLQAKAAVVEEIKEKIQNSQSMVVVNYRGLTVEEVTDLRNQLREADVDYKVYKNTLAKRAFHELGYEDLDDYLTGPNALAFGMEDLAAPARITTKFAEDHKVLEVKGGFVDGNVLDLDQVKALAKLPSKEVLIAQVLGGLNGPIQGLANVLNGNIRGLAIVLKAIAEKKEEESA